MSNVIDGLSPFGTAPRSPGVFKEIKALSITAGTPVSIWTPASATKKFRLMGYALSLSVAGSILFEDGTGNEVLRTPTLLAGAPFAGPAIGNGYLSSTAN